ncbi:hypothetical protein QFC19_006278 [Naganishia cerealis]|uniref:Uncharacterized protein n=1 Tax=Naganishia cerealis TaxID=610337 RepID=A0ACC2VJM0_9TREE|nr:hypothetical protein QFC19_006278 [Naganishia cerealis]
MEFAAHHRWQDCERDCSRVLALAGQGGNVKALYRRALARKELKLYKNAKDDLETLLKAEPSNAAAKEELAEIKRLIKAERDTPNPKKSPKDLSSFSELSSRKTNATASSLPARNRAQGVRIPIKVVPKFTTRPIISQNTDARAVPPLANSDNDESSSSKGSHNAKAFDTAAQNAPAEAVSAFSSHKASRGAKSSFVDNQPIATISSPLQSTVKAELTGSTSSGVKPPSSGLELVDRLQDLAEDGYSRWQLLQAGVLISFSDFLISDASTLPCVCTIVCESSENGCAVRRNP